MSEKIAVKRSTMLKVAVIIVLAASAYYLLGASQPQQKNAKPLLQEIYNSLSPTGKKLFYEQSAGLTRDVDPRLVYLDNLTISCGGVKVQDYGPNSNPGGSCIGPGNALNADGTGPNLGGQCCGAMTDIADYERHLENMKKYSFNPDSPPDHFNVSVALAKKMIAYDRDTVLTAEQQKIYDDAIAMSEEGPCCCRCWHWYVNSGLAKEYIIMYNFTAGQVAQYWDESDICD